MARRLLLYTSRKYNRGPVITGSEYPCRPSRRRDTSCKYSRGPVITSSKYL
jgi:hypothetical protein